MDTSKVFRLTVDYNQSLEQMIAAGRYEAWRKDRITADRFQIKGEGIIEYDATCLNWYDGYINTFISSKMALEKIGKTRWIPATIEPLLSFGMTFPEAQWTETIAAIGSVNESDDRDVPFLEGYRGRKLGCLPFYSGWPSACRFLVIRPR